MKYLYETLRDQRRIPLSKVTWDKIEPAIDPDDKKWQKDTVDLPLDFMTSTRLKGDVQFEQWFNRFVKEWGIDGELIETRPTYWKLEGNSKWEEAAKEGRDNVFNFYSNKKSGDYVGD